MKTIRYAFQTNMENTDYSTTIPTEKTIQESSILVSYQRISTFGNRTFRAHLNKLKSRLLLPYIGCFTCRLVFTTFLNFQLFWTELDFN